MGEEFCWVCQKPATHRHTKPPYEYYCEDHGQADPDVVPRSEWSDEWSEALEGVE